MANGHHNQSMSRLFWFQMCSNEIPTITEKQMVNGNSFYSSPCNLRIFSFQPNRHIEELKDEGKKQLLWWYNTFTTVTTILTIQLSLNKLKLV